MTAKFQEIASALRAHDAAQRARIVQLEELAAHQADLLEHLARFFVVEGGSSEVYDKIQAQLSKYKAIAAQIK